MNHKKSTKNMTPAELSASAQERFVADHRKHHRMVTFMRFFILIVFLAVWELCADLKIIDSFFFSSPSRVAACFITMLQKNSLFMHIGVTLYETILSFLLVFAFSMICATLLWYSTKLTEILEPYLVVLNSLPKSALAPLLIVWLGNNMRTIVVAAVSVAVFGSILTLYTGCSQMDTEQIKLIYSLGGGRKDVLLKVLLPGSLPLVISNMKVNIGLCLVGVIIGEFLSAKAGLGYLITYGSQTFAMTMVVTSIVILCIVSGVLYQIIAYAELKIKKRQ